MTRLLLVATVLFSLHDLVCPQPTTVEPAAQTVSSVFPDGIPLSLAETTQLTDDAIARLRKDATTSGIATLLDFESNESLSVRNTGGCKTYPGDEKWPDVDTWDLFNALSGNALIQTVPIASPCYNSEWGPKNLTRCNEIISAFGKAATHEDHPTSNFWPIYQGKTCMPRNDTTTEDKCTIGGYPAYVVNISSVAQIQLAVNFARSLDLRLVVKNTGHCYLGKSTGAGSLSVWTHHLKDIDYLPQYETESFKGKAFRVGAGVTVQEIYRVAHAHGTAVQGGICESVGYIGGYLQGGGHNPLSGYYGMAADSVLSFNVVTADGRFVTASEDSHQELFWALRGGGGSTFGIVTSAIVKAHPDIPALRTTFTLGNSTDGSEIVSTERFWELIRWFWAQFPNYTDAKTYSFWFLNNNLGQLSFQMQTWLAPNHTRESFEKLSKPLWDKIEELGVPFQVPKNTSYYDNYFPAYWDAWGSSNQFIGTSTSLPGNRLIPKSHWTNSTKLEATLALLRSHVTKGYRVIGYFQAPQNPQQVDNAVSSGWRNTQVFLITRSPDFAPNASAEEIGAANKELHELQLQPWREIAPTSEGGGSYLNEASVDEPDWQESFYGVQYPRLLDIKTRYDRTGVFYATTAVGSEKWEVRNPEEGYTTQNGKLCRVV